MARRVLPVEPHKQRQEAGGTDSIAVLCCISAGVRTGEAQEKVAVSQMAVRCATQELGFILGERGGGGCFQSLSCVRLFASP